MHRHECGSPLLFEHLCAACKEHFELLLQHLNDFNLRFTINKRLVRGLDYYTKSVFEVTSNELGAQKAFIAGGRYDNLVQEMGGPPTPGIGFAVGVERLALLVRMGKLSKQPSCYFASVGPAARKYLVPIFSAFIEEGLSLGYSYEEKSLKSQMRYADSLQSDYVLILGDNEIEKGVIVARNMHTKSQLELPLNPVLLPIKIKELTAY